MIRGRRRRRRRRRRQATEEAEKAAEKREVVLPFDSSCNDVVQRTAQARVARAAQARAKRPFALQGGPEWTQIWLGATNAQWVE